MFTFVPNESIAAPLPLSTWTEDIPALNTWNWLCGVDVWTPNLDTPPKFNELVTVATPALTLPVNCPADAIPVTCIPSCLVSNLGAKS